MVGGSGTGVSVQKVCSWIAAKSERWWQMLKEFVVLLLFRIWNTLIRTELYVREKMHSVLYFDSLRFLRRHPVHQISLLGSFVSDIKCCMCSCKVLFDL